MAEDITKINWYPGHMTKAFRAMKDDIKLIDLVIEVIDARLPISSRNPDIDNLAGGKARIIILNKADLADVKATEESKAFFESKGITVIVTDSRKNDCKKAVMDAVNVRLREKKERDKKKGIVNRALRVLICGIPNVGKSTLINSLAGRAVAKTGNKPGVTKGNQWAKLGAGIELLDTPGILWPKFEDPQVGMKLALIGSINENIIDLQELACYGIGFLTGSYKGVITDKYYADESLKTYEVLEQIALNRNLIKSGALPDTDRAAKLFLDDLRAGRLGRFTFERL